MKLQNTGIYAKNNKKNSYKSKMNKKLFQMLVL